MSLSNFSVATKEIKSDEGSFKVKGITLGALAELLTNYKEELETLFSGTADIPNLIVKAPDFCAELIAHAAGEPDEIEKVKDLPLGLQLTAIGSIWELTAVDVPELGKLLKKISPETEIPPLLGG